MVLNLLDKMGYTLQKNSVANKYSDIQEVEFWEIFEFCKPYTMTSIERMYSLYSSVRYVLEKGLEGDFVECGVWRGGSAMMIAKMLASRNITERKIYLYDTFEGMSAPTDMDVTQDGERAGALLQSGINDKENSVWCLAGIDDVKQNMARTGYAQEQIVFVAGKVEDTLPAQVPTGKIALLRLDTDWYESTKHELEILFPLLVDHGILLIDDYGHWKGCRKAVDEYFARYNQPILLNRVDYTGRLVRKNLG